MFAGKPIIGIVGGIGSGKSFVARLFGELGCAVIDSDEAARRAYERQDVRTALVSWWGSGVIRPDGTVDRRAIAERVFNSPEDRRRLEGLIHPIVGQLRDQDMRQCVNDPAVRAYVWDTPLLIEAGLADECDAIVFVESSLQERLERVGRARSWTAQQLQSREKSQLPLDKKRNIANYIVRNTAGAGDIRSQVRHVLSQILAETSDG